MEHWAKHKPFCNPMVVPSPKAGTLHLGTTNPNQTPPINQPLPNPPTQTPPVNQPLPPNPPNQTLSTTPPNQPLAANVHKKERPNSLHFPKELQQFLYGSSPDGIDGNLLVLFHGLGDTPKPYAQFAQQMKLPQTAWLSLQAPNPLLDLGYMWIPSFNADGSLMSSSDKGLEGLSNLRKLLKLFFYTLKSKYNWNYSNIFLLGFSQGAVVALDTALNWVEPELLGGLICISGSILEESTKLSKDSLCSAKNIPPILLTHGTKDDRDLLQSAKQKYDYLVKQLGANGNKIIWKDYEKSHQMVCSKDEATDIMTFFSKHLSIKSSLAQQEGVIEITGQKGIILETLYNN